MLYFDHNATTPLIPVAREAWLRANGEYPGNPSSSHRVGTRAEHAIDRARAELAALLGADPRDIVWTSGATESSNLVWHHAARTLPENREVWVAVIEHPCVLDTARHYFGERCRLIPVTPSGQVDLNWLERELKATRPGLMAVMAANNETGVMQPWREVLALGREFEVPFFCDAVQWIGKCSLADLGAADFLCGAAHKFGGPKGVGFLKCPSQSRLIPLLHGGRQEDGRRAGTENVAGILSLMAALKHRQTLLDQGLATDRLTWRDGFEQQLLTTLPEVALVGRKADRLWNTVSAIMPDVGCRFRWVVKLDKAGYAVSSGSACASGNESPSHVLTAMGYPPDEAARALRFSSGWETTHNDWEQLFKGVVEVRSTVQED